MQSVFMPRVSARVAPSRRTCVVTKANIASQAVGSSYASALVDLAQTKNALEAIHSDVDALSNVIRDNANVRDFLTNPIIPHEKKQAIIKKISSEGGFNSYTTNFLLLLVDKNRIDSIEDVIKAFEERYCKITDTQVAVVKSAVKLEEPQQFLIAKKLQELTGAKNIKIKPVIDESLIAGFIVEYGSAQIDLSIKGALDRVTKDLAAVKVASV